MKGLSKGLTLAKINEITVQINSSEDLHTLLTVIMDTAKDLLKSEASSLLLYDPVTEELIFDVARGDKGKLLALKRIPVGQGIAGICAEKREPVIVNDAHADARIFKNIDEELGFQTKNLLAVPMLARGKMIGVLEVLNTTDKRDYIVGDVRLLTYLSNMAALSILNRQLFENVKDRMEELDCIYSISNSTQDAQSVEQLFDSVLEAIERVLKAGRVSILMREEDGNFRIKKTRGFTLEENDVRVDPQVGITGIVLRSGDPLLVRDLEKDLRVNRVAAGKYRTSSFIVVPIIQNKEVVGVLNVSDKNNGLPFDYFELRVLTTVAAQIGDAYGRILSRKKELEIQNYKKDLETAAKIQLSSLPKIPSQVAGMKLATRYESCKEVGGDFYDLIYHSEDRISLVIADVAGKGVPAALFMEYSKTLVAGLIPRNLDPVATLTQANKEICVASQNGIFVTVMLVQLEREVRRIRFGSAGHNQQYLYRHKLQKMEDLSARGAPLGILPDIEYVEKSMQYDNGDLLLLYTDGVTECCNLNYDEFGEENLEKIILENVNESPDFIASKIMDAMTEFRGEMEPFDDSTLLIVRL